VQVVADALFHLLGKRGRRPDDAVVAPGSRT
jgi:hypothetical protein